MHDFILQVQSNVHMNVISTNTSLVIEKRRSSHILVRIPHPTDELSVAIYTNTDSCSLDPSIRSAVIKLAKRAGFFSFDSNGNPTEDFTCSRRACLVKTEEGSSVREMPYRLKQENVQSIINVNEPNLVADLQLGRWESSAKHLNQVEDSEFLKGLKNMRQPRHMPKGLALLSQLQVLKGFVIGEPRPGGNYCKLADLSGLENLRKLSIHTIHVDRNKTSDAAKRELISLANFKKLLSLSISWSRLYDTPKKPPLMMAPERELISLANFKKLRSLSISWSRLYDTPKKPPLMMAPVPVPLEKLPLVKLTLHYFPGSKIPDWLMQWELNNLRKLYLRGGSLWGNNANGLSKWCA
ncbi:hypothetical protein ACE6H2_017401 [Prunus campanulata]